MIPNTLWLLKFYSNNKRTQSQLWRFETVWKQFGSESYKVFAKSSTKDYELKPNVESADCGFGWKLFRNRIFRRISMHLSVNEPLPMINLLDWRIPWFFGVHHLYFDWSILSIFPWYERLNHIFSFLSPFISFSGRLKCSKTRLKMSILMRIQNIFNIVSKWNSQLKRGMHI